MLWLIFSDYFSRSIRVNAYLRFLRWYVWLWFSLKMLFSTGIFFLFIYFDDYWLLALALFIALLGGLYFGNEIRKVVTSQVGTHEDIYDNDIITLRQILIARNVHSENQINALLEQIDDELQTTKLSEQVIKPIYTFMTILLIPISILIIKWVLDKYSEGYLIVLQILALLVMIFTLCFMLRPISEQLLDSSHWKMKKLKQMLKDIKIIDFLK